MAIQDKVRFESSSVCPAMPFVGEVLFLLSKGPSGALDIVRLLKVLSRDPFVLLKFCLYVDFCSPCETLAVQAHNKIGKLMKLA